MPRLRYSRYANINSQYKRKTWREKLALMSKHLASLEARVKCQRRNSKNGVPFLLAGNQHVSFMVKYNISNRTYTVLRRRIGQKEETFPMGGVDSASRFINAHLNATPKSPAPITSPAP